MRRRKKKLNFDINGPFHLVVRGMFRGYQRGDRVTDSEEIAEICSKSHELSVCLKVINRGKK